MIEKKQSNDPKLNLQVRNLRTTLLANRKLEFVFFDKKDYFRESMSLFHGRENTLDL